MAGISQASKTKTYDLGTAKGAIRIIFDLTWPVMALVYGYFWAPDWQAVVYIVAIAYLVFFVAPGLLSWYSALITDRLFEMNSARSISEETFRLETEIRLERERQVTIRLMQGLNNKTLDILEDFRRSPSVEVDGSKFYWRVGGSKLPVWFAQIWLEKWEDRGRGDLLPALADYAGDARRDLLRSYNNIVTAELVNAGAVRAASSHYPPRWILPNEYRDQILTRLGVYNATAAYEISQGKFDTEDLDI